MKVSHLIQYLPVFVLASAATVSVDSESWTTLTPTETIASSVHAVTDFDGSLALSVKIISAASSSTSAAAAKREVAQISDGQVQQQTATKTTASVVAQISDGQIQKQTKTTRAASVVAQISDGQIQKQTTAAAVSVVNQISDGQIQKQTKTTRAASVVNQISDGQIQKQTTAAAVSVVNQISDGQIQKQTTTAAASVVNQIGDGQIQKQTTAAVATQISDGQVQQATAAAVASQISDGQVQASSSSEDETADEIEETLVGSNALTFELHDSILRDKQGRIGSIVANRQFQFDGPPPQAGAIYAKGWSLVPASYGGLEKDDSESGLKLALGNSTIFYQCLSGDFYNLYDQSIGGQCSEVELYVLKAISS